MQWYHSTVSPPSATPCDVLRGHPCPASSTYGSPSSSRPADSNVSSHPNAVNQTERLPILHTVARARVTPGVAAGVGVVKTPRPPPTKQAFDHRGVQEEAFAKEARSRRVETVFSKFHISQYSLQNVVSSYSFVRSGARGPAHGSWPARALRVHPTSPSPHPARLLLSSVCCCCRRGEWRLVPATLRGQADYLHPHAQRTTTNTCRMPGRVNLIHILQWPITLYRAHEVRTMSLRSISSPALPPLAAPK